MSQYIFFYCHMICHIAWYLHRFKIALMVYYVYHLQREGLLKVCT